jgi:hypothetical protein
MALIRRWLRRTNRAMEEEPKGETQTSSWWDRNRQSVEIVGIWVEALGVVTAAVLGIQQYRENSQADKVNITLKYLDRFQEDRIFKARGDLDAAWNARREEVFALLQQPDGEAKLESFLEKTIAESGLDPAIATVMDFFDELQACTTSGLCDRETAIRFFGKYAYDFHGLLAPYIALQRKALRDLQIGSGVDFFSREYRQAREKAEKAVPPGLTG